MQATSRKHNLVSLTVLSLLRERPMHPYEMQRGIRQRHNDMFVELRRGSLYHAIDKLSKSGFVEEVGTSREGKRPERTTYRITEAGVTELLEQLRALLATPVLEPSSFLAALSFAGHLTPDEVRDHLELRLQQLQTGLVAMTAVIESLVPKIGRLPLIEVEYLIAMRRAELGWVQALAAELKDGRLAWNTEELLARPGCCLETPATENEPGS